MIEWKSPSSNKSPSPSGLERLHSTSQIKMILVLIKSILRGLNYLLRKLKLNPTSHPSEEHILKRSCRAFHITWIKRHRGCLNLVPDQIGCPDRSQDIKRCHPYPFYVQWWHSFFEWNGGLQRVWLWIFGDHRSLSQAAAYARALSTINLQNNGEIDRIKSNPSIHPRIKRWMWYPDTRKSGLRSWNLIEVWSDHCQHTQCIPDG